MQRMKFHLKPNLNHSDTTPKSSGEANAIPSTKIVMDTMEAYKKSLKTRGDPPRGVYTGGRALFKIVREKGRQLCNNNLKAYPGKCDS